MTIKFDTNTGKPMASGPFVVPVPEGFDGLSLTDRSRVLLHHFMEAAKPGGIMQGLLVVMGEFEGSGDSSGDATWYFCRSKEDGDEPHNLSADQIFDVNVDHATEHMMDDILWEFINQTHPGWENNEGGFGTVTFDLRKRSCVLDYNQRVETSENMGEVELFDDAADEAGEELEAERVEQSTDVTDEVTSEVTDKCYDVHMTASRVVTVIAASKDLAELAAIDQLTSEGPYGWSIVSTEVEERA
jgi:hypothetical protein